MVTFLFLCFLLFDNIHVNILTFTANVKLCKKHVDAFTKYFKYCVYVSACVLYICYIYLILFQRKGIFLFCSNA